MRVGMGLMVAVLALATACDSDTETTYTQFNGSDDTLTVEITADTGLGEAVSIELTSTTGSTVIGTATIDPGSGPVGTDHTISVEVSDEYEDEIDRVTVRTDSGDRGIDEYDMTQDSADHGRWEVDLTSVGTEGEERSDTLNIRLWVEDDDGVIVDTGDTA